MGHWGPGSFENDDAADFTNDVLRGGVAMLEPALRPIAEASLREYVEAPQAAQAIAAAEIVAGGLGWPGPGFPEELHAFVNRQSGWDAAALSGIAVRAVKRVREASELRDLASGSPQWANALADLISRLEKRARASS